MTLEDTHNAISSPVSADGALHLGSPVGKMLDLFGQEVAHANPSAPPEKKPSNQMSATYGRIGIGSLESQNLQQFLESRLRALLPLDGGMMWQQIWKRKNTPARRRYCQLAVSVGRTEGIDYGLWPTPQTLAPATATYNVSGSSDFTRRVDVALGLRESINGKRLLTENPGHLNPQFPCWLMGYSTEHLSSMLSAMQSYRKSPQRSSKRA